MNTILVPVDLSEGTSAVLDVAADMARALGCEVCLMHVLQPFTPLVAGELGPGLTAGVAAEVTVQEREQHAEWLERLGQRLRQKGVSATPLLVEGSPADAILDQAQESGARMIILGSHGHGALYHLLLGGVSTGVLRKAKCPVLVVPVRAAARVAQDAGT